MSGVWGNSRGEHIILLRYTRHSYDFTRQNLLSDKLGELIKRFNLDAVNSHKALDDVKSLIALYEYMKKERDDLEKYINLIGYYPKYGLGGAPLNTKEIVYLPQPFHNKKVTIGKTLYSSAKCLIEQLRR